ncbi:hypothetical protein ORV05_33100 [Amycolatopsis cynarae]|uniref:Uncharacterized protein n=1 Tax=Amycolatopsis cynarae TaxID=2995223 RepID=A0ABY7B039_9PSEU|nr:hypothetical protein [Amycolatopsis sp. HUAS 11-8]WAL65659.1 hypothetical protein ORV05_33100 [Amycolatopsis sp. HUAS 11-8]
MRGRTRQAAAVGAAAFVLAGTSAFAAPAPAAAASAQTITASCGQTVTAHPGDVIKSPLGLQTVTDGLTSIIGGLLSGLCQITVKVVDTVVAPIPVVGAPVAGAVDSTVAGTTNGLTSAVQSATSGLTGKQQQPAPQTGGAAQSGPGGGTGGAQQATPGGTGAATVGIPAATSQVLSDPGYRLPSFSGFGSVPGYAPMRDYSDIPYALAGLWSPAPGLRYGGEIPGYAPSIGSLGQGAPQGGDQRSVQNAGRAEALPGQGSGGGTPVELPVLAAVLALAGVSAGLVRAWVLRGATA